MSMLASNTALYDSRSGQGKEIPNRQSKAKISAGRDSLGLKPRSNPSSHEGPPDPYVHQPSRWVSAGVDIFCEGEVVQPYLLLIEGWAAPYKCLCDGRRQFFDILIGRDGMRGLRSARDARATLSVVALTDCRVWQGNGEDLRRMNATRGGPNFDETQTLFIEQHQRMLNRMTVLGHARAPKRIAYCLLEIWRRQLGRDAVAGAACELPVTQGDIGDAVGLTGVHVCRTLATFKKLGIVRFKDGRLTVMRPFDLADIAGTLPFEFPP